MTHSSDFANAFVGLLGNIHAIGETVQIMSGETLSWNQIYQCIANALGRELKAVHIASEFLAQVSDYDFTGSLIGDKSNSVIFDCTKLKQLVPNWTWEVRFDKGIKSTIEYILSHKEYQIEDPEFDNWCDKVIATQEKAAKELSCL
jgi:nucleoside-diphosphate-sugar epimerase